MHRPESEVSAFPHGPGYRRVAANDSFPPGAFLTETTPSSTGMTLRDYLAGQALMGMVGRLTLPVGAGSVRVLCEECYDIADEMIRARWSTTAPGPAG